MSKFSLSFIIIVYFFPFCSASFAGNLSRSVSLNYDASSPPQFLYLLKNENQINPMDNYATNANDAVNGMGCTSSTNTQNGACSTSLQTYSGGSASVTTGGEIMLKMINLQTKTSKDIKLTGNYRGPCSSYYTLWFWTPCQSTRTDAYINVFLTQDSLRDLSTTPGIWEGVLKLNQLRYGSTVQGVWQINLRVTVTDNNNAQVYLPSFPISTPVINLNLNTRQNNNPKSLISGNTTLDMCLYDGSNSSNNRIDIILSDEGGPADARPTGMFSIYRRGGDKTSPKDRIDYQVKINNPVNKSLDSVNNGERFYWQNTDSRSNQKLIVLPGGGAPVLCVPAPLKIVTPEFYVTDKNQGDYTGNLRVIFTPSTQ